jgi:hypothetical protein
MAGAGVASSTASVAAAASLGTLLGDGVDHLVDQLGTLVDDDEDDGSDEDEYESNSNYSRRQEVESGD